MGAVRRSSSAESDDDEEEGVMAIDAFPAVINSRGRRKCFYLVFFVALVIVTTTINMLVWSGSQKLSIDVVGFEEFEFSAETRLRFLVDFHAVNNNFQSVRLYPFTLNITVVANQTEFNLGLVDSGDTGTYVPGNGGYDLKQVPAEFVYQPEEGRWLADLFSGAGRGRQSQVVDFSIVAEGTIEYQLLLWRERTKVRHVAGYQVGGGRRRSDL